MSLQGLNKSDLEDLLEDIKVYIELENQQHLEYWKVCMPFRVHHISTLSQQDMTIVCEDELQKLKRLSGSGDPLL